MSSSISSKKKDELFQDIYEKLYKEAEPGGDYEKLQERADKHGEEDEYTPAYMLHYMPNDKIKEIVEEKMDEYTIVRPHREKIIRSVMLGAAPSANKQAVNEARQREGLEPIPEEDI